MNQPSKDRITDAFGRPLHDIRISLIDNCNFRCVYCMPKEVFGTDYAFMKSDELLTYEEIVRIAKISFELGARKIKLTGGEPLLRPFIPRLVSMLRAALPEMEIDLITNGLLFAPMAERLREAGLDRVTISLDTLDPERFGRMTGRGHRVEQVLEAIDTALSVGFDHVKINMVVIRNKNDDEVVSMAQRFRTPSTILRYIEFMDVGTRNGWDRSLVVPSQEILERLGHIGALRSIEPAYRGETASRYAWNDGSGEVGFISSISSPFCGGCTRARISADGRLYTCLFSKTGTDLRTLLRGDEAHAAASDDAIKDTLSSVWKKRDDRYSELRQVGSGGAESGLIGRQSAETTEPLSPREAGDKIEMFYIGG